jgi:lipoprotein-releasing system ATP-binding protein
MTSLLVEQLTKSYPTPGDPLVVLRGVNLSLQSGDSLAVVGPSGSGKSTLLNLIGGLDLPSSGRVVMDGEDITRMSERSLSRFRNRKIGFVFQDHHLLPQCSVFENVLIPCLAQGRPSRDQVEWAAYLLERVGLSDRKDHRPSELSGGERQRAALARALVLRPVLILADEPTGNLDATSGQRVAELLLELQAENHAILITVTHSPTLASLMSRQMRLEDGRLVDMPQGAWRV